MLLSSRQAGDKISRSGEHRQTPPVDVKHGYITSRKPKSILCLPLAHQGKLVGILYLENNLTTAAFTQDRLEVLELLASQIAISIENVRNYLKIEYLNRNLEGRVEERTRQLDLKNKQIMDSINYARTIQLSILPREQKISQVCRDHFVIWKPRDIAGGDFYCFEIFDDSYLLGIIDYTGHGVPGAFMTMTAHSVLNRVIGDICHDDPARILGEMNVIMRATLDRGTARSLSDDGLDIGLCYVKPMERTLVFPAPGYRCIGARTGTLPRSRPAGRASVTGNWSASSGLSIKTLVSKATAAFTSSPTAIFTRAAGREHSLSVARDSTGFF